MAALASGQKRLQAAASGCKRLQAAGSGYALGKWLLKWLLRWLPKWLLEVGKWVLMAAHQG